MVWRIYRNQTRWRASLRGGSRIRQSHAGIFGEAWRMGERCSHRRRAQTHTPPGVDGYLRIQDEEGLRPLACSGPPGCTACRHVSSRSHWLSRRKASPPDVRCSCWALAASSKPCANFPWAMAVRAAPRRCHASAARSISRPRSAPQREQTLAPRKRAWHTGQRSAGQRSAGHRLASFNSAFPP
jgi:hypothetical protein